jgi:hypothetical protein
MIVSIDVSIVFDLPNVPSPNEAARLVITELEGRILDNVADGVIQITVEED